jgi:hypothetical protein
VTSPKEAREQIIATPERSWIRGTPPNLPLVCEPTPCQNFRYDPSGFTPVNFLLQTLERISKFMVIKA